MKKGDVNRSPLAWATFRKQLLEELAAGGAEAFCASSISQLVTVVEGDWEGTEFPRDIGDAIQSYRSLLLMLHWWLPSRDPTRAAEAVAALRKEIEGELYVYELDLLGELSKGAKSPVQREDAERARRVGKLRSDAVFLTRIQARLNAYKPDSTTSPYNAMQDAVWAEVEGKLGRWPVAAPNPKEVGAELRRLFRLDRNSPEWGRLQRCLARLNEEEREFVEIAYGSGWKNFKGEPGWTGRKQTRVGRAARETLARCMPELTRFSSPAKASKP